MVQRRGLIAGVFASKHPGWIAVSLLVAVLLWGGNNTGTKVLVSHWSPAFTGGTRFCCAGLLLLGLLRWSKWLGETRPLSPGLRARLWWRGGLSLAVYIVVFNSALQHTSASRVALYLGAAPVWALFWEGRPRMDGQSARRYGAALVALGGVAVLFWPALKDSRGSWLGDALGVAGSLLWTNYGRQCRALGAELSGAETSAHTMWRAGLLLLPFAGAETWRAAPALRPDLVAIQAYCVVAGGVAAFAIWSHALKCWPASRVLLFNNLIPLSTAAWAAVWLREPVTPRFWVAMAMVMAGVLLGQADWQRFIPARAVPPE